MGLDIAFNRAKAIAAGLVLKKDTNGTEEDIRRVEARSQEKNSHYDQGYIDWLKEDVTLVAVPNTNHYVQDDGLGSLIVVRANRWGSTYAPLTQWLKQHNIVWSEF